MDFVDLNAYRGVGEDPVYRPPALVDRPRLWPLQAWSGAPRDLGYDEFTSLHWKGIRILKDPPTQSAYHNLIWEIRPRTIVELGVYSGGSLVWFRDLTTLLGLDCEIFGIDRRLDKCQIPKHEMRNIRLEEADCASTTSLDFLIGAVRHPAIIIDDAHCNTFNIMQWSAVQILTEGDYFVIEDMIPYWDRYSPSTLRRHMAALDGQYDMDLVYSNTCPQLDRGVFRRRGSEMRGPA